MKTPTLFLLGLFLAGLVLPIDAFAHFDPPQPASTSIGVTGGYNRTFHSGLIDGPYLVHDGPSAASPGGGMGNGFHVGLALEQRTWLRIGRLPNLHLHVNVTYDRSPAELDPVTTSVDPWFVINAPGHTPVHRATSITYDMLKADVLLRQMIFRTSWDDLSGVGLSLGPTFGWLLRGRARHTYRIIDSDRRFTPSYARTLNEAGSEATLSDESIDGIRKVRYGLKGVISYETVFMKQTMILSPSISYDYALDAQSDASNWRANVLQVSLDVRFDLPRIWRKLFPGPYVEESNPL